MSIKKFVDRHQPGRGMERIGVWHKGAPRTDEDLQKKRPGKDLDYLRLEWNPAYPNVMAAALWEVYVSMFGAEPKVIRGGVLIGKTMEQASSMWYEEWGKSGLFHRCDGEVQVAHFEKAKGALDYTPIACAREQGCQCKQVARINVWIPEFTYRTGIYGYFQLQTHSLREIGRFTDLLMDVEATAGSLAGMPITLSREMDSWEIPELDRQTKQPTGRRQTITKSLIFLRPDEDFIRATAAKALAAGTPAMLGSGGGTPALPAPALPEAEGEPWNEAQAIGWANNASRSTGAGTKELLAALGVASLSQWHGDAVSASYRLNMWIEAQSRA